MRKISLLFALLAFASICEAQFVPTTLAAGQQQGGGGTTFTLIQHINVYNTTCTIGQSTCTLTVTSMCSGHANCVGILFETDNANNPISTSTVPTGGGTWVVPSGCAHYQSAIVTVVSCAYNLAETATTTSIVVTFTTTTTNPGVAYYEYAYTGPAPTLDATGFLYQSTSQTPQNGVTLSLTGSNDAIVQMCSYSPATSVNSPYGDFLTHQLASADLVNS